MNFINEEDIIAFFRIFYKNQVRDKIIQYDNIFKQLIKITSLIINTCVITYVLGCFWYRMSDRIDLGEDEPTFIKSFFLDEDLGITDVE